VGIDHTGHCWPWLLVALVVVAVAQRRLGPSSSATTSMLVAHLLGQLTPSPAVQLALIDGKGSPDYDRLFPRAWLHAKDDLTEVRDVLRQVHRLMVDRQGAIAQILGVTDTWHAGPSPELVAGAGRGRRGAHLLP
jgi:hypothetical protein